MTDLGNLNIADIERKVKNFGNLFYHRTVILERIRKIAFRNMIHRTETERCCRSVGGNIPMECVQAKMLSDQGLENNVINRTIIGWATYYPVQLYLALFYAEIEFYEKLKRKDSIFTDGDLDSCLNTNRQLVNSLGKFRDGFLHPSNTSVSAEFDFLQQGLSYNIAPILQKKLDAYLLRLKAELSSSLFDVLRSLPEIQKLYCYYRFTKINMARMKLYHDLAGMERCVNRIQDLSQRIEVLPDEVQAWSPNPKQTEIVSRIAQCLNMVHPSQPEIEFTQPTLPAEIQTAMRIPIIPMLVSGQLTLNDLGSGRHATHLRNNIGLYRRLLITGLVLLNECLYDIENPISLSFLQQHHPPNNLPTEDDFLNFLQNVQNNDTFGLQEFDEWVAPCRIITALFYELLRIYSLVIEEIPPVANQRLDALISSGKLENLSLHRNSIFHTLNSQRTYLEVDLMSTTSGDIDIFEDILVGILDFWGIFPELSNTS